MERAQEQATKWGPAKGTLTLGSLQQRSVHTLSGVAGTHQLRSIPCPSSQRDFVPQGQELSPPSVTPVVAHGTASLSARTQTTFSTPVAVTSDQEGISSLMDPSQFGITLQPQAPISSGQQSQLAAETSQGAHAFTPTLQPSPAVSTARPVISGQVHTLATEPDQFEPADVPSHMHLSCDILPCPHQRALIEKGRSDQTIKIPLSSPVVESMLEELQVAERDTERVQKPQRTIVRESREKEQIQHLPRNRNGSEEKEGRSSAGTEDSEREERRRKEVGKRKSKPTRVVSQEPATSDMLISVIGEVKHVLSD